MCAITFPPSHPPNRAPSPTPSILPQRPIPKYIYICFEKKKRFGQKKLQFFSFYKNVSLFCLSGPLSAHIERLGAELQKEPISLGTGCIGAQRYSTLVHCLLYAGYIFLDNMYIDKISSLKKNVCLNLRTHVLFTWFCWGKVSEGS